MFVEQAHEGGLHSSGDRAGHHQDGHRRRPRNGLGSDKKASLTGSLDFQGAAGEARARNVDRHIGAGCQAPHAVQAIWTMTV